MEYPELAARTRRFSYGAPRGVSVSGDGKRVVFLRSSGPEDPVDALWTIDAATGTERLVADPKALLRDDAELPDAERALRERLRLSAAGIGAYSLDTTGNTAVFALAGKLFRADVAAEEPDVVEIPTAGQVVDPRVDPTGRRAAYVSADALHVVELPPKTDHTGHETENSPDTSAAATGRDLVLAAESGVTWGMAEFIGAEEFHRFRGHWWSPDGRTVLAARVDESRVPRWHLHDPAAPDQAPTTVAYPHAGADNAQVTLHLLDLDGGWVDVHWDRETYPYLVAASWSAEGPLITVLRRLQHHGLVLAINPRTGETQVHAELTDQCWVESIPGTAAYLPDGRVLVGGDLAHDGYDARCLFADGSLLTPPQLYVRRYVGLLARPRDRSGDGGPGDGGPRHGDRQDAGPRNGDPLGRDRRGQLDLIIEASAGEPSEQHVYRVPLTGHPSELAAHASLGHDGSPTDGSLTDASPTDASTADGSRAQRLTSASGWHHAMVSGSTLVVVSQTLEHAGIRCTVYHEGTQTATIASLAAKPPYAPRPLLTRVTDRRLPAGVLYPRSHVAGRRLPVLVDIYGGPGHQEVVAVRSRWQERQWWADQGFAVVVVDNRGTPGVAPSFDKAIHRRMADVVLTDQVDALNALVDKHPDLDLSQVAIRGWSFGGWLAALAVLRRPDVYRVGVAGAPVTDWALYDTAYTERYLGMPADAPDVYAHHSLVEAAEEPPARLADIRPLLLIHGMVDDNVVAAHTMRLSAAMLRSGRQHAVVPLTAATHMAAGGLAERLLRLEVEFIRQGLRG